MKRTFEAYLTELSIKTLQSYIKKAKPEREMYGARIIASDPMKGRPFAKSDLRKYRNRSGGIDSAQFNIAVKK